jgi:hypothetical protein
MFAHFGLTVSARYKILLLLTALGIALLPLTPGIAPSAPAFAAEGEVVEDDTVPFWEPDDIMADVATPDAGMALEPEVMVTAAVPVGNNQLFLPALRTAPEFFVHEPIDDGVNPEEDMVSGAAGTTYYVDCSAGNDNNSGLGTASAWKSLNKANNAPLRPGDKLLFKRGCAWKGPLKASWNGTSTTPITISSYGTGSLPKFRDSYNRNVSITGSYQIISYIEATQSGPVNPDPNCNNQSVAWKAGFSFDAGAHHNTLRYAKATYNAIGVYTNYDAHHNKIMNNTIVNNNMVWQLTSTATLGAMGVLLHGDYNEVGYNYFSNNKSICTYTGTAESNSVELYGARYSDVHHNTSINDRVFSEIGGGTERPSTDNTFTYNLHVVTFSDPTGARFVIARGEGHKEGPTYRTLVYHNTLYYTAAKSKAISCQRCATNILTVKSNVFWVEREPISVDGPFVEARNVFWSNGGNPLLNFTKDSTSVIANPQFRNPSTRDFRLQGGSRAIDRANTEAYNLGFKKDLTGFGLWYGASPDTGAYEWH